MESMSPSRPFTFRVENIPPGTTAEELKDYFYTEDQPGIRIRSIVPAVDNYELDVRELTATVTFQALNRSVLSPRLLDDDISIDCDFHGFTPLSHPSEPIAADIIAVTGLTAHAFGSWAHSAQNMWLRDYLPRDVGNARILLYGYPSQLQGNMSRSILSDHSTNMIQRLLAMRESAKCQDRPIVFIGHSLGCLIIKKVVNPFSPCKYFAKGSDTKALCDINGSVGIYSSRLPVRLIIFLGAPHKGLETTALETLVKSQATEDMIRELKSESPTLTELNDKFRHVAKNIDILTCYELSPTKTAITMPDGTWKREGPPIIMVPLDSARQWYPREELVACNADHAQIAKLKRGENSIYPSVRWAIKKALLRAGDLYNEAKGIHQSYPQHLSSADESSTIRRSLLEASHCQVLVPSNERLVDPAPLPSRSRSENAINQQVNEPHQVNVDQSTHHGETQSNSNPRDEPVFHRQSSIEDHESDDTQSSSNPTDHVRIDLTSVVLDDSFDTSNSTKPATSSVAGAKISQDPNDDLSLDSAKIESEDLRSAASQSEVLEAATDGGAKGIMFDDELQSAIVAGDEDKTRECFARKYDVNCRSDAGITPLLMAARHKHENIVRMLLEQGADPDARDVYGLTTLHRLTVGQEIPISETLIDLLLRDRPPLDVPSNTGNTPLITACLSGEYLLATKLVSRGAKLCASNSSDPFTPLHAAAHNGSAKIVSLLFANGAELEVKDKEGWTPLHYASAYSESVDTVEQLLLAGAEKEATNNLNSTPLHTAAYRGRLACVAHLLKSSVNVDVVNKRGATALHAAVWNGHLETVEALLDHGANPTIRFHSDKPSAMFIRDDVTPTQKKAIRALLKDAEKAWTRSDKK